MADKVEAQPHLLTLGLKELSSRGIYTIAKISDLIAVPMFWHIGNDYKKNGFTGFRENQKVFQFFQAIRTLVPAFLAVIALTTGDQKLFAVGGGFVFGGLLDMAISTILTTGIKQRTKAGD